MKGRRAKRIESADAGSLADAIRAGDRRALARAITLVESTRPDHRDMAPVLLEQLSPDTGKSIRVAIVSEATGEPLSGVSLRLGYPFRRATTTQAEGVASFVGLMSERYELTAEAKGYARAARELDLRAPGRQTEVALRLAAGGIVRGVVTDADGTAVIHAMAARPKFLKGWWTQ